MKKLVLVILAILVCAGALGGCFDSGNAVNTADVVAENKKEIVDTLKANPDIVDFLENEMYSYNIHSSDFPYIDESVFVTYENSQIEFSVSGQSKKIDKKWEKMLISVFEKLKCINLSLHREQSMKALKIVFDNVTVSEDDVYTHSLTYSKVKNEDYGEEVMPDWYYDVLFYT